MRLRGTHRSGTSCHSKKESMIPVIMRNDPSLAARPQLRREMENWWAGSLWDPRSPQSGDFFGTDFTCSSSMPDVLAALRSSDGYSERLALAVTQDDLREAQRLLGSADVTPALHLALKIGASPETVDLLATCCEHLNVWLPEPVVVTWARASCRAALECSTKRCHSASGATGRLDALLWAGADVNAVGRGCGTALHIVARMLQLLRQERGYGCAIKNEFQVLQDLEVLFQEQRQETLRMLRKRLEETFDGRSLLPGTVDVMRTSSLNSRLSNSKVRQVLQAAKSEDLIAEDIEDSDSALDLPVVPKPVVKVISAARQIPDTRVGPPNAFPVPEDPSPNNDEKATEKNSIKGGVSKPSIGTTLTRKQTARAKMEQQMVLLSGDQMERLQFRRTWLQRFTSHWIYENVMSFLIVANSLILGLQVQVLAQDAAKHAAQMRELPEPAFDVFFAMHWLFCIAFSIDLTLRWWADGFWDFFQGVDAGWNIFDIFVVAFAIVDVIVDTAFLSSGSPTSVLNSRRSFTTLRVLRVVRIIRVLRVVRMLTFFRELRMMIHSTIGCFKSVFFVMVLFGALLYIFGIAFTSAFIDHMAELSMWQDTKYADLIEFFGTVTLSGLSLYQAMSGGRDWHVFFQALETMEGQVWSYIFLFYTLVAVFAIVNIVAAVFVDSAMQFSKADHQLMVHQEVSNRRDFLSSLGELFQAIDIDDNGFITRDEFDECLKQEKFMAFFRAIKLDYRDAQLLFDLLDSDQSGKVTVDEFIDGCAKLQGEATALETKVLHLEVQMVRHQLEKLVAISGGTGSFFCTSSLAVPTIKNSPSGGNSP